MSENTNNQPENSVQFSGPYPGDERDPQLLGDILPEITEDLARRSQPALQAARAEYGRLIVAQANGDQTVTDAQVMEARTALEEQEEQVRKLQPPTE